MIFDTSGSIMHYSAYGFAIDPTVPTIIVPDGVEIGQRIGFSEVRASLPILSWNMKFCWYMSLLF